LDKITVVVDVCADLVPIIWLSQHYRIISVHIRIEARVYFGSYIIEHALAAQKY